MIDKFISHHITESVYQATQEFITARNELESQILDHMWAHRDIIDLVPEPLEKLGSGHIFPFLESFRETECSLELLMQGFYRHSFFALRSALELVVVGLFFDKNDQAHLDIQDWLHSVDITPRFKHALKSLFILPNFASYNKKYQLQNEIEAVYYSLSDYVHLRGYHHSDTVRTRSNKNSFNQELFMEYVGMLKRSVQCILLMMLLKYPIGVQQLPIWEKFGFDEPIGGFLNEASWSRVMSVLPGQTKSVLQEISNSDYSVRCIVEWMNELPDLTESQVDAQWQKWKSIMTGMNLPSVSS